MVKNKKMFDFISAIFMLSVCTMTPYEAKVLSSTYSEEKSMWIGTAVTVSGVSRYESKVELKRGNKVELQKLTCN